MPETPDAARIAEIVQEGLPRSIAELSELVRIPSVSWAGFDRAEVRRSAEKVAELARATGVFQEIRIVDAPLVEGEGVGQPAVIATRAARNGRPTILLYAHHDVQPPGDETIWNSLPFEPTLRGERLFGRGVADDKAGVTMHLSAIRALVESVGDPDLGISLFIEGEEEFGSGSFRNLLAAHQDTLAADVIVVGDSSNWDLATPALTVGLRGAVAFNLRITTLDHAVHSGMFGGAIPDAMMAALRMLSTLWDENGEVAVAGLTSREADTPDYDETRLREESGVLPTTSPIGSGAILSRMWNKPSITVTGIDAPTVQNASNTLVPSVRVRISTRVAPGQSAMDAYRAVKAHLEAHAPFGAILEEDGLEHGEPFLVDTGGYAASDALEAMAEAWGAEPVRMGVGGTIPFIADLVELFPAAQILITGVEDPDGRAHSPNESVHLPSLHRAILSEALLLSRLNARSAS